MVMRMWVGLWSDALHLEHIDDGQEADKKKKEKYKETNRSDKEGDIDPSG